MKKLCLVLVCFLLVPFFLFAKSTYRVIKATSTSENPGVVNVQSTYKAVDDEGKVVTDSKSGNYKLDADSSYTITSADKSADIIINKENANKAKFNDFDSFFDDFNSSFSDFDSFFNDFESSFRDNSPFGRKRINSPSSSRKIAKPAVNNKVQPSFSHRTKPSVKNDNARRSAKRILRNLERFVKGF